MATPLESLIVRESTEKVDDRNIMVALTEDQRISFRLKGMKSGVVSIPIKELYEQLAGEPKPKSVSIKRTEQSVSKDEIMIPLSRLRVKNATTPGQVEFVTRLDELIVEIMEEQKSKS